MFPIRSHVYFLGEGEGVFLGRQAAGDPRGSHSHEARQ